MGLPPETYADRLKTALAEFDRRGEETSRLQSLLTQAEAEREALAKRVTELEGENDRLARRQQRFGRVL